MGNDVFDVKKRSEVMRCVKNRDPKSTERKLGRFFREHGITGWRRQYKVKGKPDFAFVDRRVAIFLDGCFWHGHDCRNVTPKDNAEFWQIKIAKNRSRDVLVTAMFEKRGWTVIRIWECQMKREENLCAILGFLLPKEGVNA